jgi:arginine decarboxylase
MNNNPKVTIFHLDDSKTEREKVKKLEKGIKETFNSFFKEYFIGEVEEGGQPTKFDVEIIQSGTIEKFRSKLFSQQNGNLGQYALTQEGRKCILFLIDYYLSDDHEEDTINNMPIDNISFTEWLGTLFPAIPKILLTKGEADKFNSLSGFKYVSKGILDNQEEFLQKLLQKFREYWEPVFWQNLFKYGKSHAGTSWHTPGHNHGNAFHRSHFQKDFYKKYSGLTFWTDLSVSVDELGDLSEPDLDSPMTESRKRASKIFGSEETFFITNGTSTSNKAMLMTLLKPGEVVLLDRNCHKSVHQAVVMSGALPLYMPPLYNKKLGVWAPISIDVLEKFIYYDYPPELKPRMLILTSCTYEGILYPINDISGMCEDRGILFYADEAWAPYLRFHPYYVQRVGETFSRYNAVDGGAHFVVQSTHKALAAFSQASMLHVSENFKKLFNENSPQWEWLQKRFNFEGKGSYKKFRHDLFEVLRYWHSTSPHYPMIATLDRAGIQMSLEGLDMFEERLQLVNKFNHSANEKTGGCIIEKEHIVGSANLNQFEKYIKDPLKIVIGFKDEYSGKEFKRILKKEEHIQWEKSSSGCIEFLVTVGTYNDHIQHLLEVVRKNSNLLGRPDPGHYNEDDLDIKKLEGQVKVLPQVAAASDGELVELSKSEGRISSQMLVPYPPGIPVFLPGLEITSGMIEIVQNAIDNGNVHDVHGIFEDKGKYFVKVMTEDIPKKGIAEISSISKEITEKLGF